MLTPNQQRIVWEGWLSAETRSFYFADLSERYQRRQTVVTWLLLVASSSAAGALLVGAPVIATRVLAFATAALSLWTVVAQFQTHVTACTDLHFRWNTLATRYAELWDQMYDLEAPATLRQLKAIAAEISKSSTGAPPYDPKRMEKWEDLVIAQHRAA